MCDKCDWGILLYCILHLCIREITTKNNVFGFIYINRFHDKKKTKSQYIVLQPPALLISISFRSGKSNLSKNSLPNGIHSKCYRLPIYIFNQKVIDKKKALRCLLHFVRLSSHGTWYALFLLIWQKAHVNFSDQDLSAVCRLCRRRCCYKLFHIFIFFRTTKSISTQLHTKHHWVMWIEL